MPPPYKSPGRCIYCGEIPSCLNDLTDEHIIAETLSANLVLPNACCSVCQKIVNKFETTTLRGPLLQGRLMLNLKRNKSKTGPQEIATAIFDGEVRHANLGHEYFPAMLLPILNGPLALLGLPPNFGPITFGTGMIWTDEMLEKSTFRWKAEGIQGLQPSTPDVVALTRTLFKIAHAFAMAEIGWGNFRPLLVDEILGRATFFPNYFVGNSFITRAECEQHLDGLHDLSWRRVTVNGWAYLVLRVQLFSLLAAPFYDVVVGT